MPRALDEVVQLGARSKRIARPREALLNDRLDDLLASCPAERARQPRGKPAV
jgi:hypothetical protein